MVSLITGSGIHHGNWLPPCQRASAGSQDETDAADQTLATIENLCK
jgi:hypothetical protein